MKHLHIPSIIAIMAVIASCADRPGPDEPEPPTPEQPAIEQRADLILPESALMQVDRLLNQIHDTEHAGLPAYNEDGIIAYGGTGIGATGFMLPDSTIYIINFEDNAGFAVMAASAELKTTSILCITESGSLYPEDLNAAIERLEELSNAEISADGNFTPNECGENFVPMMIALSIINQVYCSNSTDSQWSLSDLNPDPGKTYSFENSGENGPYLNTKWHGDLPFSASSATVAVAQILEYICPQWGYNHPTHEFDWELLGTVCNSNNPSDQGSTEARLAVEELVRLIESEGQDEDGIIKTFTDFGLKNITVEHETSEVFSKFLTQIGMTPLYLSTAINGQGHSFVLDGYMNCKKYMAGDFLELIRMYHVNWGLNGLYDGYYNLLTLFPHTLVNGINENTAYTPWLEWEYSLIEARPLPSEE